MASSSSIPLFMWFFYSITFLQVSLFANSHTYIIHMDLSAMPKVFSDHHSWYAATISSLSEKTQLSTTASSSPNLIYSYTNVLHGFSASLSPYQLEILEKSSGFIAAIPDLPVKLHTTHTPDFLNLNSVSGVWPESDYGRDIIVGVVDTGVWPESNSFNDDGYTEIPSRWKGECVDGTAFQSSMCNKKLIGAKFFNQGLLSSDPTINISMNSPRDTSGHGSHTSSTAAGNYVAGASYFGYASGTAKGMAPNARVAIYKAIWKEGAIASDVLAACDHAIEDGVDVLSLSISIPGVPLHEDPIAIASFAAMEKGIFVSAAAGNEGPKYGVVNNGIPWLMTVAAGTIDRELFGILKLGNGVSVVGSTLYPSDAFSIQQLPLVYMNCSSPEGLKKVGRKIVACLDPDQDRSLIEQVNNVENGDASGGIFITQSLPDVFLLKTLIPALFLSVKDGKEVLDYIDMSFDPRVLSLEFQKTNVGKTIQAPRVGSYSSRGPSASFPKVLKPDIMGPGTLILASWSKFSNVTSIRSHDLLNNFNILSGTSMACPHVSGIGALLKGIHPEWSPAAIRSAIMTTADSVDNTNSPITDIGCSFEVATPLAMGAGHINPNRAADPGLVYDANSEDYVKLLCSTFSMEQIKTITRSSSHNCSNQSSDLNYPSFIAFFNVNESSPNTKLVQEFTRTVTNVGEGIATYTAKLAGMDGFLVTVEPRTLVFQNKYEKKSYKLRIVGPKLMRKVVAHGSLSWEEVGGREHVVRSPIVATTHSPDPSYLSDHRLYCYKSNGSTRNTVNIRIIFFLVWFCYCLL